MGSSMTPDSYCSRCHAPQYVDDRCTCPTTCTLCKREIERADKHGKGKCVPSDAEHRAIEQAEQAFWDACVASVAGHLAQRYTNPPPERVRREIAADAVQWADALVVERRKRIAARAKGG